MLPEISLNILDAAQNSISAGALLTEIGIKADSAADTLKITVADDGRGMTPEQVSRAADPFFTTRSTRSVGLGIPFFKMAAELTGGSFLIESAPLAGTRVTAVFGLSHIDRMPLGDVAGTVTALVGANPELDFVLRYSADGKTFVMDTRELRQALKEVPLSEPCVLAYITELIDGSIDAIGKR